MTERQRDDSPMTSAAVTFLRSPIVTLASSLESRDVSPHDLLDAYSIFILRIHSVTSSLVLNTDDIPALGVLAQFSEPLARRLQLDIRRALEDPLASASSTYPPSSRGVTAPQSPDLYRDAVYAARDASMLSQYALRVVAIIVRFPRLYSLFSDTATRRLLDDTLIVARALDLPCVDDEKVCGMATSIFSVVQLPPIVLEPSREALLLWLKELSGYMSPRTDSSKVIHHMLSTYPAMILPGMVEILPTILTRVVSMSMPDRIDATIALAGYALAFLSDGSRVEASSGHVVKEVRKLLARPPPGIAAPSRAPDTSTLLSHLFVRSIKGDKSDTNNVGTRWAVTVVCSFICLTGHRVFSGRKACMLAVETAERVYNSKQKGREELLACLWRCLVWAFSKIPADDTGTSIDDPRTKPFTIVMQELRFGTGACLIATLLHRHPGQPQGSAETFYVDVERAVMVLKAMVSDTSCRHHVYRDGVWALSRMVSGIGSGYRRENSSSTRVWTPDDLIVKDLFSRQMATVDASSFASTVRRVILDRPQVRPLEEAEIQHVWDGLRDIWIVCVRRELQSDMFDSLSDELVGTWQALLLVRTHLTQEQGHLTATEEFTESAVTVMTDFLDWSLQESKDVSPLTTTTAQSRALSLCSQLWTIVRNVFSDTWLSHAASVLLTRILQRTFETSSEDVKTAWSRMCAALLSASSPGLVARLVTEDDEHRTLDLRRELWHLAAKSWASMEPQPSWDDSVEFLCIPVGLWSLSDKETVVWDDVLDRTVSRIGCESAGAMFDSIIQRMLAGQGGSSLTRVPWLITCLSRWREVSESTLATLCTFLVELYPDTQVKLDSTENLGTVLQFLAHIGKMIRECPPVDIMSFLPPLADGLATWIGDEYEYVPVQEYNAIIVPIYCDALQALRHIPLNSDTLYALARFLRSTFNRIPEPASGPRAFYDFWKQVEPSLGHFAGGYPEDLKAALCVCHQAFNLSLPSDMSIDTDSQSESQAARSILLTSPGFFGTPSKGVASPLTTVGPYTRSLQPLNRSPASSVVSPSPAGKSTGPWLPTADKPNARRLHMLSDPVSPTPARRSSDATPSSSFVPSSPTDAMRVRRFAKGPSSRTAHERPYKTPDRPLKRRKLSPQSTPKGIPDSSSVGPSSPLPSPSKRGRMSHSPNSATPKRRKWLHSGVEVQSPSRGGPRTRTVDSSTPQASPSKSKLKEEQFLSPEVPSPTTAARARARAPPADDEDDYDAWEVPIVTDDDVVPPSQPDDDNDHEDSLIPSFMKAPMDSTQPVDDMINADDDVQDHDEPTEKSLGKRPERRSPLRMHTAPASFIHDPDSIDIAEEAPVPVRRARTESVTRLEELRNMCDALEEEGSQLDVDQLLSMSRYASLIGTITSEKLSKKLSGGGSSTGSVQSHGGKKSK